MTANSQCSRSNKQSIKYRSIPLKISPLELDEYGWKEDSQITSTSHASPSKLIESRSTDDVLGTRRLLSAIGDAWVFLNQPNASGRHLEVHQEENIFSYSGGTGNDKDLNFTTSGYFSVHLESLNSILEHRNGRISPQELPKTHHEISFSCSGKLNLPVEFFKTNLSESLGFSCNFERVYDCISQKPFYNWKDLACFSWISGGQLAENHNSPVTSVGITNSESSNLPYNNGKEFLTDVAVELLKNDAQPLKASYPLGGMQHLEEKTDFMRTQSSTDYHLRVVPSKESCENKLSAESSNGVIEGSKGLCKDQHLKEDDNQEGVVLENKTSTTSRRSTHAKASNIFAQHRHALAGALAGTFVSLCLHPLDTVKTIIQARTRDQKSLSQIFASVVSDRGLIGLYRGIGSNIASSAPISAVYTFTYETVKGSLLPFFPKEYHSLVHCTAGGCASIATSFIFTPSECVKQQMQVGSRYQNSWSALVGILAKGGVSSLYAGWGAVLCRNIPHSIIKFYTYESLKQFIMPSLQPNGYTNPVQTLVCGGLAGTTAALFTTPFDVVKTRLQTQIPGSVRQYNGVFHVLQQITKNEGVKGLYRGLTPRLVMYMTQGALFFASYEFFKSVFFMEMPQLFGPDDESEQKTEHHSSPLTIKNFRS
ncbi:hypothetical protein H6P81_017121 [Aristolochia fimbriata]|uniref:Mitochondrial substrate carrier family protein n=1 Tax=Aristolochia fimbriata TaxID=158543 RepID=A0AAV7E1K8_ARIFI|nr:hypothetical protein H6P81_017121 [Aristolochia fimbriata]